MKIYKNLKSIFLHTLLTASVFSLTVSFVQAQSTGKDGSKESDGKGTVQGQGQGQGTGSSSGSGVGSGNAGNITVTDDMRMVLRLFEQKRYSEAVPYLERIVRANPNNPDFRFFYGFALLMKAGETEDKTEARKLRVQARKELEKARELGMVDKDLDKIIAALPADETGGSSNNEPVVIVSGNSRRATYSSNKEAQEFMEKGEQFFAAREYQKAFQMYENALKKDPNIYEAALFSGDVFLQIGRALPENDPKRKENFDKAESWYQKAIIINPNRETAYRYSATPLMLMKQYDKARDRYIEAYITEPYNERALGGLKQWAEVTETEIGHPLIDIPNDVSAISNNTEDGSFAWSSYFPARALWQSDRNGLSEKFKNAYPNESVYRRSLAEEIDSLGATVSALKSKMNSVKKLDSSLATLVKLYDEGLLESYILLAIRDNGIAKDHTTYIKENRQKMRQYVIKYVVGNN